MPFKIYVDSRFRKDTGGTNSDSDFTIELPHPINVKGRAYVDVVCIDIVRWMCVHLVPRHRLFVERLSGRPAGTV